MLAKLSVVILSLLMLGGSVFSAEGPPAIIVKDQDGICPRTHVRGTVNDCLKCHVAPTFRVREADHDEILNYPISNMRVFIGPEGVHGWMLLEDIDAQRVQIFLNYLWNRSIKRAVLEIHSPGGSLFDAWKIVGLMKDFQSRGMIIETRCYGFAASAGFLIFATGTKGCRYASPTAEFMWHELLLAQFGLRITNPSGSEDESRILRHLQDTANEWLSAVGCISKKDIDNMVHKREWWLNGREMVKYCFADHLIGE